MWFCLRLTFLLLSPVLTYDAIEPYNDRAVPPAFRVGTSDLLFFFCELHDCFKSRPYEVFLLMNLAKCEPHTVVLLKKRNAVLVLYAWLAIVFLPGFVESSFALAAQEEGEVVDGRFVLSESLQKKGGDVFDDAMCRIECEDFIFERASESEGGGLPFGTSRQDEGVPVRYPRPEEDAYYSSEDTDQGNLQGTHLALLVLSTWAIGATIGTAIVSLCFRIFHGISFMEMVKA